MTIARRRRKGGRGMRTGAIALTAAVLLCVAGGTAGAQDKQDRHAGYYYPQNVTNEEYVARAKTLPIYDRKARIEFTDQLMLQVLGKPYPPPFVFYAKGEKAEKAILVAVDGDFAATLYRMRAFLALMTTLARQTELFKEFKVDDLFTFFDQLKILGFEQLTVSDGKDYAHQIHFK